MVSSGTGPLSLQTPWKTNLLLGQEKEEGRDFRGLWELSRQCWCRYCDGGLVAGGVVGLVAGGVAGLVAVAPTGFGFAAVVEAGAGTPDCTL
jgi:hypothetical protein